MPDTSSCAAGLLGLAALLLASSGDAEGARRFFDCEVTRHCDAGGQCEAASGEVSFAMEPLAVGSDGAGRYSLRYQQTDTEMEALSEAGPFRWRIGAEQHTLLASSETALLWHQLDLSGAPTARIAFLSCSLRY